jgi:transposase
MLNARILISKETVNELVQALQRAYKAGDAKLVRRITALLNLSKGEKVNDIAAMLGVAPSSIYEWLKRLMIEGVVGLKPHWKGGRPAKLTPNQRKRLAEMIDAGPQAAGFRSACWNSAMIQELIQREFGKLYNVHYVSEAPPPEAVASDSAPGRCALTYSGLFKQSPLSSFVCLVLRLLPFDIAPDILFVQTNRAHTVTA